MPIDTTTAGGRAAKFEDIGDRIDGVVVSADEKPQTDINTGDVKTWNDGRPIMQWVVTLATDQRDPDIADDDGHRTVYAKGGRFEAAEGEGESMMEAIRSAVKASGAKLIEAGGRLQVAHTGLGKSKTKGFSPPKLYRAKYTPPAATTAIDPFAD